MFFSGYNLKLIGLVLCFALVPALAAQAWPDRATIAAMAARPDFVQQVMALLSRERDPATLLDILDQMVGLALNPADGQRLRREKALMLELLGNWQAAASAWELAWQTQPQTAALDCLAAAATAWLNGGHPDKALDLAQRLLDRLPAAPLAARAHIIMGWAHYMQADLPGAMAKAVFILALNDAGSRLAALELAIAAGTPAEREAWQRVLRAEYGERPASTWPAMPYMLQGLESFSRQPAAPAVTAQPAPSASGNPAAASQAASATGQATSAAGTVASPVLFYQVGAFSSQANAEDALQRLQAAGFSGLQVQRSRGTTMVILVYVAAGVDPARTLLALKDAGFEAWPLISVP
ncbi:MAG: hypothetical protein A2087_05765 [Spirochaetes bacterium GWD1_61_31]|nr:MAG: hypothetical protein A2Y37_13625 [Spirochaetes bacterium GWB1_60_80]OHD31509.1 MAG: hypothetical protein A2004_13250 [Spirochaetes bacterium GWC1_61_12]OHD43286.1 MAG: hypothetical protein A2087_05765 [Spirochaetes bacterium GWD1_61_31]OHD45624.1 MAG: hypothetical protein A2Y35_09225 [Spirochaetes bacterium GWE1_60_18]OHD60475.1 MAG: hypothetical protein A2Y32_02915 [Spirochaetes bacterium GWF1_60_12]HAP44724.1 hypothetical protein [Spirochaetaceae bacterium]